MKRILVVDDLPDNLYLLEKLLTANGFIVDTAKHGADAFDMAKSENYDIIISDLLMPVMDGYTLLKKLKSDSSLKNTPFIVYTATYTDPADKKLALEMGADAYIIKPINSAKFLKNLQDVISKKQTDAVPTSRKKKSEEKVILKLYNELLIRKLESKLVELEKTKKQLKDENTKLKSMDAVIKRNNRQLGELAAHLQSAQEDERKRIAREIHDELGQQLTAVKMDLAWINKKTPEENTQVKEKINSANELIDGCNISIRKFLSELRTDILEDFGLVEGLKSLVTKFSLTTGIPVNFKSDETKPVFSYEIENTIFRLFQESLTNIMRYAGATKVNSSLKINSNHAILCIEDDGKGFTESDLQKKKSFGILGMKERVSSLDGRFDLATAPGKGTKITVSLPIHKQEHV